MQTLSFNTLRVCIIGGLAIPLDRFGVVLGNARAWGGVHEAEVVLGLCMTLLGGHAAHENLIDNKQFGAALGQRAVCPCIVGHLVALAGLERHRAAVLKFRDQLAVEDQQDVAFVAPVIGEVVLRIFDHTHAQFAELPGVPIGDAGLAGMLGPLDLRPVRRAERDIGHFHSAPPHLFYFTHSVKFYTN